MKTHILKEHTKNKVIKCESCEFAVNDEKLMIEHKEQVHQNTGIEEKEEYNDMEVDINVSNKKTDKDYNIKILEEKIVTITTDHEDKVRKQNTK